MKQILVEKMHTNSTLREYLKKSQNTSLLHTVADKYWGVGMSENLASVSESHRGSNVLGLLWEEIREIYHKEIYKEHVFRCELCRIRRSDVQYHREQEKNLCTLCISGNE